MRKVFLTAAAACALFAFNACKKSDNVSNARSTQNLSGSYTLKALTWSSLGITANVYDSLPACERDNIIQLNTDLTANFLEGPIVCDPSEADNSTWSLSSNGDSLYIETNPYLIKSWDGKTLVITGIVDPGPPAIVGTTTLVKK